MLAKTPVTIVTGFLGAGKTTLIRHLMANAGGRRLALIINEFGDVGVDGDLVKSCADAACPEDAIIELANGCICCTVADDFAPALTALIAREPKPDHIVVETSGLEARWLPKPLIKAFDWPELRTKLTVDGVIAVVDAAALAEGRFADDPARVAEQRRSDPSLDHDNPLEEVYEDQLMSADLVVLNKADLVGSDRLDALRAEIAGSLPRAVKIASAREGVIDPNVLLGVRAAAEDDLAARPSHHDADGEHDHDDFDTFVVAIPTASDPDALIDRLSEATRAHDILRIKGFVEVAGKPMRMLVQGVGSRFRRDFDRPWSAGERRQSRLVVIAQKGVDREAVAAALEGEGGGRACRGASGDAHPPHRGPLARRNGRSGGSRPDTGGRRVPVVLRQRPQCARERLRRGAKAAAVAAHRKPRGSAASLFGRPLSGARLRACEARRGPRAGRRGLLAIRRR